MSGYDLFSRRFKADPFPTFAALRSDHPVFRHVAPDGRVIWYISRYEDIVAVLKDHQRFVKDPRHASAARDEAGRRQPLQHLINENMLFADPPDHTRLRALVSQAFTPTRVEGMRGRIKSIADNLLDRVENQGQMDLIIDYALPLPLTVISDMLGVPPADRHQVADWSQAIISPGSRNLSYSARRQKVKALVDYLHHMFQNRQKEPRDDLITALVQAEEAGERLSENELSSMVALLLVTGHETTVNFIGNGALALLDHRPQLNQLLADPKLWPAAVEELLRFDGPVETSTTRWVGHDTEFAGYTMGRGDIIRPVLASANRDKMVFEAPDHLDFGRPDNRHLAFGLGIHYCLGAPLARLEGQMALSRLFDRLPGLRRQYPERPLEWRSGVLFRGLQRLPLSWDREQKPNGRSG